MQVDYNICPNVLLEKEGFITVNEQDNIKDWQAYIQSCGISAQVFIKNKDSNVITKIEEMSAVFTKFRLCERYFELNNKLKNYMVLQVNSLMY